MNNLIFCSFEVGGFPYKMAEVLNRHGAKTYYVSLASNRKDYNSTEFHYGKRYDDWNLSSLFTANERRNSRKGIEALKKVKAGHDIKYCFATGHKSYLLKQAGMDYDYWSYGSDLDQYCESFIFPENFPIWKKAILLPYFFMTYCREQRRSIIDANRIMIALYQIKAYQRLCPDKEFFFTPHLINVEDYKLLQLKKDENKKKICQKIGAENYFFSPTRHFWAGNKRHLTDNKANDIILHAFKRYLDISHDTRSKIILVRRGPDVLESAKLIEKLEIKKYIIWINELARNQLLEYYQGASVCFGQFGTPVLNFSVVEPLSNASPCASFVEDNKTKALFYPVMPPIFNSNDPEKIADFMHRIISDTGYASGVSYNSWLWAKENCSEEKFVEIFISEANRYNKI